MRNKLLYSIAFCSVIAGCGSLKKTKESPVAKVDKEYITKFHEGVRYKLRGEYEQAIQAFESCLAKNPNDDAAQYALSELYLQTKQTAKSTEAIQKAAKLDPKNQWYTEEIAYMYYQKENFAEAAKAFQKLTQKEPRNIDWLFAYAECLMRSNDASGAVKALDKLEDQTGMNPELTLEKFRLYRKIKQDDKAVNEITKALKDFPADPQLLANLVDYYFEKKQPEKAFEYLIKLAEADPSNGNAQMALAQYYDQKGDRKSSYGALKKAFESPEIPLDTKIKIVLSMYETQFKLDPEMLELSDILVDKYPVDAKVYAVKGDFLLKNEKNEEALIAFKKALEYDDSKYVIWEQVLIMEYQKQDFENLFNDSKKCLEMFPTIVNVHYFNGVAANQTKRFSEGLEVLTTGIDLIVNDKKIKAEFLAQIGESYFGLSKLKEAQESYDEAVKTNPDNILILNNYAYQLARTKTNLSLAETMILKVLKSYPKDSRYLDTYGWVLFNQGKYNEALGNFEDAYENNKTDKLIIEHLGDASFKTGKTAEAIEYWKKAKALGATNKNLDKKIEKKDYYDPLY